MPNLGKMIKNKREAAGLSQKRLGTACGLSDSEIMKIENGQRKTPSWKNLCKIAQALGFHPFEILLEAGYITKKDINPEVRLHGLDKLNENDIGIIQLFVDFMISKKGTDRTTEGGL